MKTLHHSLVLICTLALTLTLRAQEPAQWYDSGSYLFNGGLSLGYRSATASALSGGVADYASDRYYEQFNYRTGVCLSDFSLFGQSKTKESGFFNELYLNGSGINDPYTNVGLRVRSFENYDFNVSLHRSKEFFHRPDSLWSDLHSFDYTRQTFNSSLLITLVKNIGIELDYNSTGRDGNEVITTSTYYYGVLTADFNEKNGTSAGTSNYGSLGTNNYYWMNTPRNDKTNDVTAKLHIDLPSIKTNLVLGGGQRSFDQDVTYTPYSTQSLTFLNEASGIGTASASYAPNANGFVGYNIRNEALKTFNWEDKRTSKTPYFFGSLVSKLMPWCTLSADVRYESTTGSSANAGLEQGLMRKITTWYDSVAKKTLYGVLVQDSAKLQTYQGTTVGSADMTFKRMIASALLSCKITNQLEFTARMKYYDDKETASTSTMLSSSLDSTNLYNFTNFHFDTTKSTISYTNSVMTISPQINYAPMPGLGIRVGLTISTRTPKYNIDTIMNAIVPKELYNVNMSKKTTSTTPVFSVFYKPVNDLALRVRYEMTDNSSSFDPSTLYAASKALSPNYKQVYSGAAPQFDMITPDSKSTLNADIDYTWNKDLTVSLGYRLENSKGDLTPWYTYYSFYNDVYTDTTKTKLTLSLPATGDLTFKSNISSITGAIRYAFTETTNLRLGFQLAENHWSLPFSGLSSNIDTSGGKTAPFGDLRTGLVDQDIKTTEFDVNFTTELVTNLNLTLSAISISCTGGGIIDPNTVSLSKSNTYPSGYKDPNAPITGFGVTNPRLDMPWVGGPYSSLQLGAMLQYMITHNFGVGLDYQYVKFNEDVVDSYVGLTSFTASMIKFSVLARL